MTDEWKAVSALSRNLLRLAYGLPPDPNDAEEFGRIFDATTLYGTESQDSARPNDINPDQWRLQSVARNVVTDYAEMACDDLAGCACSMAQLARLLAPEDARAT